MASFNPQDEKFNPSLPDRDPPNFLGYSQGIGSSHVFSTLFEGVGNAVEGAAKGTDYIVQEKLRKEAQAGVNDIQNLFGVDAATTVASESETSIGPAALKGANDYLSRLQSAYESGSIKESHYLGQLNAFAKQLRARYPGYDEQVDNTIQSITGLNPANAIVSALRQEAGADKSAADHQADQIWQFEKQYAPEILTWRPDYFDLPPDKKPSPQEMIAGANHVRAQNADIQNKVTQLSLLDSQGKLAHQDLVSGARDVAGTMASQALNAGLSTMGSSFKEINDKINNYRKTGTPPSPEEQAQWQNAIAGIKTNLTQSVINGLGDVWFRLKEDERKDILSSATAQIDNLSDALNNQQYGVLAANAAYIKATQDTETRHLLEKYDIARKLSAAKDMFGETGVSIILNQNIDDVSRMLSLGALADRGSSTDEGVNQTFSDMKKEKVDPQTYTSMLDANVGDITGPDTSPETSKKAVNWLFETDGGLNLSMFDQKYQTDVFSRLVTPAVTNKIKELSKDDPTIWKSYSSWVYRNFHSQYGQLANTIRQIPQNYLGLFDFYFDQKTGELGMVPKSGDTSQQVERLTGQKPSALTNFFTGGISQIQKSTVDEFSNLNKALQSLKPVLEADGQEMGPAVQELLGQLGIPIQGFEGDSTPEDPNLQKQSNLLDGNFDVASTLEGIPPEAGDAIRQAATELDINPTDLATTIAYETMGTFSPSIVGGKGNRYQGLIQFGPEERARYGVSGDQTFSQQMKSVVAYLKDRGLQPGSGLLDIYSTINAGRPGKYNASDRPGETVTTHVNRMRSGKLRELAMNVIQSGLPVPE